MKRYCIIALALLLSAVAGAQNIQLHYDFGSLLYQDLSKEEGNRPQLTSTVEMFKPDKGGSTFFFVDMDYRKGVFGAYWEIAREFNFWQESKMGWLSAHIEYNGGLNSKAGSYNDAWLIGPSSNGHSKDYSKTWGVQAMYKLIPHTVDVAGNKQVHNFQLTGIWGIHFANGYCSFTGFVDFWREHRPWQGTEYIFLTEPQFWVNLNAIKGCDDVHLSFGTEVEISNNFVGKGFYAIPTLAAKWTF